MNIFRTPHGQPFVIGERYAGPDVLWRAFQMRHEAMQGLFNLAFTEALTDAVLELGFGYHNGILQSNPGATFPFPVKLIIEQFKEIT